MKNIKVGDLVKCIDKDNSDLLTVGEIYVIIEIEGNLIKVRDDSNFRHWYLKHKFITDSVINYDIPTYEGDILKGKQNITIPTIHNINIPRLPDIDLKELSQNLYKGVQREMKLYSIKKLHKDIKNIYFNESKRTTVIVFKNGDKVKATANKDTPFSEYAGFVTALFKYEKGLKLKDVEHLIKKKRK